MPHVLYNHITHSWDQPELDDGCRETAHDSEELPEFTPSTRRAVARLALGAVTALASFIVCGLVFGLLLEIP